MFCAVRPSNIIKSCRVSLGIVMVPLKSKFSSSKLDLYVYSSLAFFSSSDSSSVKIWSSGDSRMNEERLVEVVMFSSGSYTSMSFAKRPLTDGPLLRMKLFKLSMLNILLLVPEACRRKGMHA